MLSKAEGAHEAHGETSGCWWTPYLRDCSKNTCPVFRMSHKGCGIWTAAWGSLSELIKGLQYRATDMQWNSVCPFPEFACCLIRASHKQKESFSPDACCYAFNMLSQIQSNDLRKRSLPTPASSGLPLISLRMDYVLSCSCFITQKWTQMHSLMEADISWIHNTSFSLNSLL